MRSIHDGRAISGKKDISDLKYLFQERVILHDVFSIDEAHNKAMKIERLQNRASPFKSSRRYLEVPEISKVSH